MYSNCKIITCIIVHLILSTKLLNAQSYIPTQFSVHKHHITTMSAKLGDQKSVLKYHKITGDVSTLIEKKYWLDLSKNWFTSYYEKFEIDNSNLVTKIYQLDYSMFDTISEITISYDNFNRPITATEYRKDIKTGNWNPHLKSYYSYSFINNVETQIILNQTFDINNQVWINDTKYLNSYNNKKYLIKTSGYNYENDNWDLKYDYSSNIKYLKEQTEKYLQVVDSSYDTNSNRMYAMFKIDFKYNNYENESEIRYYSRVNQNLKLSGIDSLFFDSTQLVKEIRYTSFSTDGYLKDKIKITNVLFEKNKTNKLIYFGNISRANVSIITNLVYEPHFRFYTVDIDSFGSYEFYHEYYNNNTSSYNLTSKYTKRLDSLSNVVMEQLEIRDYTTNNMNIEYGYKISLIFLSNKRLSEMTYEYYDNFNSKYVPTEKIIYSDYRNISTNINQENKNNITIFPNPATSQVLTIKHENLTNEKISVVIYDLHGKIVAQYELFANGNNTIIDIDHIENGIYMIKLESKNENLFSKFIKQ